MLFPNCKNENLYIAKALCLAVQLTPIIERHPAVENLKEITGTVIKLQLLQRRMAWPHDFIKVWEVVKNIVIQHFTVNYSEERKRVLYRWLVTVVID